MAEPPRALLGGVAPVRSGGAKRKIRNALPQTVWLYTKASVRNAPPIVYGLVTITHVQAWSSGGPQEKAQLVLLDADAVMSEGVVLWSVLGGRALPDPVSLDLKSRDVWKRWLGGEFQATHSNTVKLGAWRQ